MPGMPLKPEPLRIDRRHHLCYGAYRHVCREGVHSCCCRHRPAVVVAGAAVAAVDEE